jgi:hypothetical protein
MVNLIKASLDVSFHDPRYCGPFLSEFPQGSMTASTGPESVTTVQEEGSVWAIVDRFEDHPNRPLNDLIFG